MTNQASDPAYSPSGTRIVFSSDRDGDSDLYIMDTDGTDVRRLTNQPGDDTFPPGSRPDKGSAAVVVARVEGGSRSSAQASYHSLFTVVRGRVLLRSSPMLLSHTVRKKMCRSADAPGWGVAYRGDEDGRSPVR